MKPLARLLALLLLAACGAGGAPEIPKPGVTTSAEASFGIARNGTN